MYDKSTKPSRSNEEERMLGNEHINNIIYYHYILSHDGMVGQNNEWFLARGKDLEQYGQDIDRFGIWVYIHLEFSLLLVGIDDVIPPQGRSMGNAVLANNRRINVFQQAFPALPSISFVLHSASNRKRGGSLNQHTFSFQYILYRGCTLQKGRETQRDYQL